MRKKWFWFFQKYEDVQKQNSTSHSSQNSSTIKKEIKDYEIILNTFKNINDIDFLWMTNCVYLKNYLIFYSIFFIRY